MENKKQVSLVHECVFSNIIFFLDNKIIDLDKMINFVIENKDQSYVNILVSYLTDELIDKLEKYFMVSRENKDFNLFKDINHLDIKTLIFLLENDLLNIDRLIDFIIDNNYFQFINIISPYANKPQTLKLLGIVVNLNDPDLIFNFVLDNEDKLKPYMEFIVNVLIKIGDIEVILDLLLQCSSLNDKYANELIESLDISTNFYYIINLLKSYDYVENIQYFKIVLLTLKKSAKTIVDELACNNISYKLLSLTKD